MKLILLSFLIGILPVSVVALGTTQPGAATSKNSLDTPTTSSNSPVRLIVIPRESTTGKIISGVIVTNLDNGDAAASNDNGNAVFLSQEYSTNLIRLAADSPGYISRVITRQIPEDDCTGNCDSLDWTINLYLDQEDWAISPVIGSSGNSHSINISTGIFPFGQGSEYKQTIDATVPDGAWSGDYRIGFSPMDNSTFNFVGFNIPAVDRFPIAGFSFRLLDPSTKNPVLGEPIQNPIHLRMDPAIAMDLTANSVPIEAWRFDPRTMVYSTSGVVSAGIVNGMIELLVNEPGTYQVFAGDPVYETVPQASRVKWELCGFNWREGCSLDGLDPNFDLPAFACATYTGGQAEEITTSENKTKEKIVHINISLSGEAKAKLPIIGGVQIEASAEGGIQWKNESTWTTETKLGTRIFTTPPMCGESCLTVKLGIASFCEYVESMGENGPFWSETGSTKEEEVWGGPCTADDLAPCE